MEPVKTAFDSYTDVYKIWGEVFNTWTKSASSPLFAVSEPGNWFRPFQQCCSEWENIYEGCLQATQAFPWSYGMFNKQSHTVTQGVSSMVAIYDSWLRNIDKIARKQAELCQEMLNGKEIDVGAFFDNVRTSYSALSKDITKALRETLPKDILKGMGDINKTFMQFLDSFPEEQKQVQEMYRSFYQGYVKLVSSGTESLVKSGGVFNNMLTKGEISLEVFSSMFNTCGEAAKENICTFMAPLSKLTPSYRETADSFMQWSNTYFDFLTALINIPLKIYQGLNKTSADILKTTGETFKKEDIKSFQDFFEGLLESYQNVSVNLMNTAQVIDTIPKFTTTCTDYLKSSNALVCRCLTPPFASKNDLRQVWNSLEEIKRMAGSN